MIQTRVGAGFNPPAPMHTDAVGEEKMGRSETCTTTHQDGFLAREG